MNMLEKNYKMLCFVCLRSGFCLLLILEHIHKIFFVKHYENCFYLEMTNLVLKFLVILSLI